MMTGLLVIISSPSGGGKDVVINTLLKRIPGWARLVSTTTRPLRPGNKEGVDYFFITPELFEQGIKKGEFLEYNVYAGNYYGTPRNYLEKMTTAHKVVLSQIEVNGKHNLDKLSIPHLSIFMLPDSLENLKKRIEKRGGITPEVMEQRMKIAVREIEASVDYDYRIVNVEGQLNETIAKIEDIILKRIAETIRQPVDLDKNA